MTVEDRVVARIGELVREAERLGRGNEYGQVFNDRHKEECGGWITAALNAVQLVCPNPENAYRKRAEALAARHAGYTVQTVVAELAFVLRNLLADLQAGLLTSITDRARAETFDDFLDHAAAYLKDQRKQEAGVIAGVVFEDSLRRVARKHGLNEKGENLDNLISQLAKLEVLSGSKTKRARAAAHVRTKATHAQWDEFDLADVAATIEFTRELISTELEG